MGDNEGTESGGAEPGSGEYALPAKKKGVFDRIKDLIAAMREKPGEDPAEAGKRAAQGMADELPDEVMPHEALARKKKQYNQIDDILKDR